MNNLFFIPEDYEQAIGKAFYSNWVSIDQQRISDFGRVTNDPDPHHIDPEWTAKNSPWGDKTISFGWLTASMLSSMLYEVMRFPLDGDAEKDGYPVNYGFNRMRFVEPVIVDSCIRTRFLLKDVTETKPGRLQFTFDITMEIEGVERPALVGEYLCLWIKGSDK
jgi:acyl dehydratase